MVFPTEKNGQACLAIPVGMNRLKMPEPFEEFLTNGYGPILFYLSSSFTHASAAEHAFTLSKLAGIFDPKIKSVEEIT